MSRGSTFKIFGDRSVMSKIDLFMKSEIIDEALEKECHEIEVDDSGHKYIFENYASRIYSNVRKIYDIKNEDLSAWFGVDSIPDLDIKISTGKGGAFFLKNVKHSKLLIKSITPGEYEIFKQFTDKYYSYTISNPKTLLTPIFGIFTLALSEDRSIPDIHFIVMKTVFDPNLVSPLQKMLLFDLKGSEHGRRALDPKHYEKFEDMTTWPDELLKETLKDNDFKDTFRWLNLQNSETMKTQLFHDSEFLCNSNFMDYSLLLFMVFDFDIDEKDETLDEENDIEKNS